MKTEKSTFFLKQIQSFSHIFRQYKFCHFNGYYFQIKFHHITPLILILFFSPAKPQEIKIHPHIYLEMPDLPSPSTLEYGTEVIIHELDNGCFRVLPVTQEKGEIYSCLYDLSGKGNQLWVDEPDFHSLGNTGLHSERELIAKQMITGRSIDVINFIARPGGFSNSGFIGEDEEIISVLKGDNEIVMKLGMTHFQLAKPLFHVWNAILGSYFGEGNESQNTIYYNGHQIYIMNIWLNGYQESIFHDEIEGRNNIHIWRNLNKEESGYLHKNYPLLSENEFNEFVEKLTHLHISEMNPFYIVRYGFYEGHTAYRADPFAIALIFGLKTISEIDELMQHDLHTILYKHYSKE